MGTLVDNEVAVIKASDLQNSRRHYNQPNAPIPKDYDYPETA
jgi:hypothetical protein